MPGNDHDPSELVWVDRVVDTVEAAVSVTIDSGTLPVVSSDCVEMPTGVAPSAASSTSDVGVSDTVTPLGAAPWTVPFSRTVEFAVAAAAAGAGGTGGFATG